MEPIFFTTPAEWRAWLEANHESAAEVSIGFYKKGTGKPSMTWAQSVDEALCFGWIDGRGNSVDEERFKIRFTPRKKTSIWSAVNIKRVAELTELGLMHPKGIAVFELRKEDKSVIYSHEQAEIPTLTDEEQAQFEANGAAWAFFQKQPPGYRKSALWHVVSAKRADTRQKRLALLIEDSANGRRLAHLDPKRAKKA